MLKEILHYSFENFEIIRICMENRCLLYHHLYVSFVIVPAVNVTFDIKLHGGGDGRSRDYQTFSHLWFPFFLTHGTPLRAKS